MDFRILGTLEVLDGSESIRLGGPQQRAVLAHLILGANRFVPTERLIDLVWGEDPPPAVRKSLQSHVSHLRGALGAGRLESRPGGYLLHAEPGEIDSVRFAALVEEARRAAPADTGVALYSEALALWRGGALDDLRTQESLTSEIVRLEELRLSAIEEQVAAELGSGRSAELVGRLETLVASYPLRETLWAHLMVALYRSGRQAEALAQYQRLRHLLAEQLGIDPSVALQTLELQILSQDESLTSPVRALRGYRLLDEIGRGPNGIVHRAIHPELGREVAIKVVDRAVSNHPDYVRRFTTEAQAVARLEHPHVVPLYDYWRDPEGAYLVMRYMRGGNLGERLEEGVLETDLTLRIVDQVTAAVAAAHRQDVVHGDIRPENILFDSEANAYLSDFVIAGQVPSTARPGRGTTGARRHSYRAPEAVGDEPPTPSGDVYSVGVVAFEMLTGRHPFADRPLDGPVASESRFSAGALREFRPDLPVAWDEAIARATARDPSLRGDIHTLANSFRQGVEGNAGPVVGEIHELRNPYKGLRAFLEADADDLFGRRALIEDIVSSMGGPASRFLAVVGPSGCGKSSVVLAGVIPELRRGALPGSDRWFVVDMVPGAHPFTEMETALRRVAVAPLPGLGGLLERDERGITEAADQVLGADGSEVLIIIDQFEEMFVLAHEPEVRRFLAGLTHAATAPQSRVRVIVTLRADFYDRPLRYSDFGELLAARTRAVPPLSAEGLAQAIARPAEAVGVIVEPELLAEIVADVRNQPGALPLLQYSLTELFIRRRGSTLTLDDYQEIGGAAGALAHRAEAIFHGLDASGKEATRQLFTRLVSLGEGTSDTRRRANRSEVITSTDSRAATEAAIDAFARHRLLSLDRDARTRSPTVEVAHESLLVEWPRLRGWIDDRRDDIRVQQRLAEAAREWDAAGRDSRLLARSGHLGQFQTWEAGTDLALSDDERAFYQASLAQREIEDLELETQRNREAALERRAVSRRRALIAVSLVAAVVAGGLALVAGNERDRAARQAQVATARGLAAAAVANIEEDAELSLLLALEAIESTRRPYGLVLPEAEEALHRGLTASRVVASLQTTGGALDWHPDGQTFITEGPEESGLIDIRSVATGQSVVEPFVGHDVDVNDVAFSSDGALLATTGDDGSLKVWDARTADELLTGPGSGQVWGPSFGGASVAAAWPEEGLARVWSHATGELIQTIERSGFLADTALSPDGSRLAVPGDDAAVVDIVSGDEIFPLGIAWNVFWSPDGRWIVTSEAEVLRVFDAETGERHTTFVGDSSVIIGADWSPDSTRLVTTSDGADKAKVWELTDEGVRQVLTLSPASGWVAFSSDGNRVMTDGADTTTVNIWDVSAIGGRDWATFEAVPQDVVGADFTPDGYLVTSDRGRSVTVWDPETRRRVLDFATVPGFPESPFAIEVTEDGGTTAAASGGLVAIWDTRSGEVVDQVNGPWSDVSDLDWSVDDRLAITTDGGRTTIVDRSGRETVVFAEGSEWGVGAVGFSPDGKLLATSRFPAARQNPEDEWVDIKNSSSGEVVRTLHTGAFTVAFDPTGAFLATGGPVGAEIWEISSGERLAQLPVPTGLVTGVAYSPDGTRLATSGTDGVIRLWDVASGVQRLALRGHTNEAFAVGFSRDGSKLVSTGLDGTVRVWAVDVVDLMELATSRATRALTDDECRQYLAQATCPSAEG